MRCEVCDVYVTYMWCVLGVGPLGVSKLDGKWVLHSYTDLRE